MSKQIVYTSKLPEQLMKELDAYSGKLNVTKKYLIEKALIKLLKDLRREEYRRSFKRMAKDKEHQELAEMGIADYLKIIED